MDRIPAMVDMKRTPAEVAESTSPISAMDANEYPYGLCICLCNDELEKLGLTDLPAVGDMLHIHAMAKVTSVSSNDTGAGENRRVELQIVAMVGEDEDEENEASERQAGSARRAKMYGG